LNTGGAWFAVCVDGIHLKTDGSVEFMNTIQMVCKLLNAGKNDNGWTIIATEKEGWRNEILKFLSVRLVT
jgi:hypothetical protein